MIGEDQVVDVVYDERGVRYNTIYRYKYTIRVL